MAISNSSNNSANSAAKSFTERPVLKQKNHKATINVEVKLNKDKAINDDIAKEDYQIIDEDEALLCHTFTYLLSIKGIVGEEVVIKRLAQLIITDGLQDKAQLVVEKYIVASQEEVGHLFSRRITDSIRSQFFSHFNWFLKK